MIEKNYSNSPEQNRKTPTWILKPLIDPRDKMPLARNKNIACSSDPHPTNKFLLCLVNRDRDQVSL